MYGPSIETLSDLRDWAASLKNWQIENVRRLFYGSGLNLDQARYFVGPVAARMAELEGPKLGGFLANIILLWLSGAPFVSMRSEIAGSNRFSRIEDLVPSCIPESNIYCHGVCLQPIVCSRRKPKREGFNTTTS